MIRPYPLTDNRQSSHLAVLTDIVNGHKLFAGRGIQVIEQRDGVTIKNTDVPRHDTICFRGEYDFTVEYFQYDSVYVSATSTYLDQNGSPLTLSAGYYICNQYIPASTNGSTFFLSSVVPAFTAAGGTATDNEANAYRWYSHNTYYPKTNYSGSISYVSDSGFEIAANIQFWQFLGGGAASINWYRWNETSSYSKGSFIWADPNGTYVSASISSEPPLSFGCFLVVNDVPAAGPSGSRTPTGNVYYPFSPTWDPAHITTVTGSSGSAVTYNQIFYEPISPMLPTQQCVNNVWTNVFICMVVSGSLYYQGPLPYGG